MVMNLCKPEKGYKFIKLDYPEFVEVYEGDDMDGVPENAYVIEKPVVVHSEYAEQANVEEFNTGLNECDLLTNYWKGVDGQDEELLKTGLRFVS